MKRFLFSLLIVGLLFPYMVYAGGSIFGKKHKESNENGVYSLRVFICKTFYCSAVIMKPPGCEKVPHSTLQYGVCMCDSGYKMQDGQCVEDSSSGCNRIDSCHSGYFCNFGGEGTPNVCQKIKSESFEYNGVTYYYNKSEDLTSWCRPTEESQNNCSYGYLSYYGAYDWCLMQGARLLKSEEIPTSVQSWLSELPWDGNMTAYWLDDGRILYNGTVSALGDTTGWEGAGGVVCVKDISANIPQESTAKAGWLPIDGCECNDDGLSTDISDDLCNIQCCKDKYGDSGYYTKGSCCKDFNDLVCICGARCPGKNCPQGKTATPDDDYCRSWYLGLV